jgi:hypothetical protein
VADSLERALTDSTPDTPLHQGMQITQQQLLAALRGEGVVPMPITLGSRLAPARHKAVGTRASVEAQLTAVDLVNARAREGRYPVNLAMNTRLFGKSTALLHCIPGDAHETTCNIQITSFTNAHWEAFKDDLMAQWLALPGARPHWAKQYQDLPQIAGTLRRVYGESLETFLRFLALGIELRGAYEQERAVGRRPDPHGHVIIRKGGDPGAVWAPAPCADRPRLRRMGCAGSGGICWRYRGGRAVRRGVICRPCASRSRVPVLSTQQQPVASGAPGSARAGG